MNYYKTKEAVEYTNRSKSTIKRLLKDLLNKYSLDIDSPIEAIQSRTEDIKKIINGNVYYWELSQDVLDTIRTYPNEINTDLVNISEEDVDVVQENEEPIQRKYEVVQEDDEEIQKEGSEDIQEAPEDIPESIQEKEPTLTKVLLDQIESQKKIINDLNERLKESNYNTNILTKQLTSGRD